MKTRETMAARGNTKKIRKLLLVASAEEQYAGGGMGKSGEGPQEKKDDYI